MRVGGFLKLPKLCRSDPHVPPLRTMDQPRLHGRGINKKFGIWKDQRNCLGRIKNKFATYEVICWFLGLMASCLPGCLAFWLRGFLACRLPGFAASRLPGFLAPRLLASWVLVFPASWFLGFLASRLPALLATWLVGFVALYLLLKPLYLVTLFNSILSSIMIISTGSIIVSITFDTGTTKIKQLRKQINS